ncbi:MAG: hypothetical protein ACRCXA_00510 [Peptostreptococcaceae bacterium]
MIICRVADIEKRVYVDVSGYITKKDAKEFLANYKSTIKGIKLNQYNLVVTPSIFQCEDDDDIRSTCMMFFKSGYKKIYLVDENDTLIKTLSLKPMEKKLFLKAVKVVPDKSLVK